MGTYLQKQAAANRLRKIACAARVIRRNRQLQKQAEIDWKSVLTNPYTIGILGGAGTGAGLGALVAPKGKRGLGALLGALGGGTTGAGSAALYNLLTTPKDGSPEDRAQWANGLSTFEAIKPVFRTYRKTGFFVVKCPFLRHLMIS